MPYDRYGDPGERVTPPPTPEEWLAVQKERDELLLENNGLKEVILLRQKEIGEAYLGRDKANRLNEEAREILREIFDYIDNTKRLEYSEIYRIGANIFSQFIEKRKEPLQNEDSWTVIRACPEHRNVELKPFKWGPPPHHPCPNCEYKKIDPKWDTCTACGRVITACVCVS